MTKPKRGPGRGGYREGSGRKRAGPELRVTAAYSLPPDIVAWVADTASAEGTSQSAVVERAIEVARAAPEEG